MKGRGGKRVRIVLIKRYIDVFVNLIILIQLQRWNKRSAILIRESTRRLSSIDDKIIVS